jgi:TonB family protein
LKHVAWLLSLAMLCVPSFGAQTIPPSQSESASSDDAAWQRYLHILRTSTLEWSSPSEPFLLKVEYQLYDLDGKPTVKGTAEESWTETDGRQIRIQSPTLVIGDEPPADRYAIYTRESYLVHQALRALARPFPSVTERKDFAMDEFHQTLSNSELSCFSLIQPGTTRNSNSVAYCTDADNRIVAVTGPLYVVEQGDFRRYRGHEVPNDLKLSYEGKPAVAVHVTELDPLPASPASKSKTMQAPTRVPADIVSGLRLKTKEPKYPAIAKAAHIQGVVLITGVITTQGTIAALDVIASPDKTLTQAARDAVKTWTYRPYLLNGVPTEVETTINVNFAFVK